MLTGRPASLIRIKREVSIIIGLVLLIGSYAIYNGWHSYVQRVEQHMQGDTLTISLLINSELEKGLKLLNLTKPRLSDELLRGGHFAQIDPVLNACMEEFGLANNKDQFGLLLVLDSSGRVIARSGVDPNKRPDFSNRFYFTNLRDNPAMKFTLSRLRIAETTGKPVFHLAVPLRDSSNAFLGVLALQLDVQKIERQLQKILRTCNQRSVLLMPDGQVCYQYPLQLKSGLTDSELLSNGCLIQRGESEKKREDGKLHRTNMGSHAETSLALNLPENEFGLSQSAMISARELAVTFLKEHTPIVILLPVTCLMIAVLYVGLFHQTRDLEEAIVDSNTDYNTGLSNRRALKTELPRLISYALRVNSPLSVLFIDIDHFKSFNDLHGHDFGDKILKEVARCILNVSKRPLDCCCRWGGDEFVMLLPDTKADAAVQIANNLIECIRMIDLKENGIYPHETLTVSIGITTTTLCPKPNPETLMKRADEASLRAKEEGRNRAVLL